ncbi:CBS domain-containing protein [Teredinibacter purpureus]|uniref:CBS domain-containing protein n=1 Tax=Teredinibacter purpureus TaxID=2731756 RepID=UPI0005F85A5D|nr:CBS domain-containing protein [Teredinibacter purpureus]
MIVSDIMSKRVHSISPDENLDQLRSIFKEVHYRHLLVQDGNALVGVISDRDVMAHLSPFLGTAAERDDDRTQLSLKVRDIMTPNPIVVDPDTTIDCASILLIENPISCLPVVYEDNSIAGILSWKDILQFHVYGIDKTFQE